jgi:hypothetical protein
MSGIFLAVKAGLSIRELNKVNVHCVSCALNVAVSKCDQNISQFTTAVTAQQFCELLCLLYKMVVPVERIDVCLEVIGK